MFRVEDIFNALAECACNLKSERKTRIVFSDLDGVNSLARNADLFA